MKNYWNQSITFKEYMDLTHQRLENPKNEEEKEKAKYYELGLQRMERSMKTFKSLPEFDEAFNNKNFKGKILIISEPWCGDASATVPVLCDYFNNHGIETKIFLRDSDLSLIDQFLTNGTQSIPKVIILNEDFTVKNTWGPRTEYGTELLKKFKANPEEYPRETFYNDLQKYYAKNKGKDVILEIINLL